MNKMDAIENNARRFVSSAMLYPGIVTWTGDCCCGKEMGGKGSRVESSDGVGKELAT